MPDIQHKSTKDTVGGTGVISTDEEQGIVEALVSVTGIVDNVNDIIVPGAYEKTLKERRPKGVWSHDWNTPVSKAIDVKELMPGDEMLPKTLPNGEAWPAEAGALWVKAQFNLETAAGRDAFSNVKFFEEDGEWSIGYSVPRGSSTEEKVDTPTGSKKVRKIKSLNLFEYSPVLFGAASNARTFAHSIKSILADEESREEFLDAFKNDDPEVDDEEQALADAANAEDGDLVDNSEEKHAHDDEEEEYVGAEGAEEVKDTRDTPVRVQLTGALVEQLKTLKSEIDRILAEALTVQEEKTDEPIDIEEKSLEDAIEGVVASTVDAKVTEDIDLHIKGLRAAIDSDADDIKARAIAALDLISEALADAKTTTDEKNLKILANSVGTALRSHEEKATEEVVEEKAEETNPVRVEISAEEWEAFKNFSI